MLRDNFRFIPKPAVRVAGSLLFAAIAAFGQTTVNMTAAPSTLTMPDGAAVPMWGYTCAASPACAPLSHATSGWSPVVITVPTGQSLTINLTNSLSFAAGTGTNTVPTSLVIVGQLGGGLGTSASATPSPDHSNAQGATTWPIAGGPGATAPTQGQRVQSFSTEVAAGKTTSLKWTALRPGTYLLESGTHPSIQVPMGLYGMVVVTTTPSGATAGTAYPASTPANPAYPSGVTYGAEANLLFSEIDPVQNVAVQAAVNTPGFSETTVWSGLTDGCGNPASATYHQCYPPAVNYTPLYYLINGTGFNRNSTLASSFPTAPATGVTGSVLVRMVNAGSRMHVPSIVGSQTGAGGASAPSGFSLVAEDGNPLPGVPRVQSEVFMAASKTYDVTINAPAGAAFPVYDRQLSLSGNATERDAGMVAYISVNGGAPPSLPTVAAAANPDTYYLIPGKAITVSDPAKGVISNDVGIMGVKVTTPANAASTLTLNADGTFTYVPGAGVTSDSFGYCGNGAASGAMCTTVTIAACTGSCLEAAGGIQMNPITFTSNLATTLSIKPPGILAVDKDSAGYPLTVKGATTAAPVAIALTGPGSGTATVDPTGGFTASVSAPGTYSFSYNAQNSQGTVSAAAAMVTLIFPAPTNLAVTVLDGSDKKTTISDYRWIIEEDRTFYIDPTKTTNTGTAIVPTFGTNFHTSYMPVVATGCTGTLSCQNGQTLLGQTAACDVGNGVCRTGAAQLTATFPSAVHLDPTKRYYISVLPGDAATPFNTANASKGHGMGGASIAAGQTTVSIYAQPTPLPPSKLSVFVYEDDFPLNGEQDGGGGVDVLSPNEPGLGGFNIELWDDAGGSGDATGQMTYDMFNMPLANSLSGTKDPVTGLDACPISANALSGVGTGPSPTGITGMIVTCPKYEADHTTLSPLAGQAVVANLMPGRYGVVATPAADRIARGEEWLQTNTLDGQKAHDSFLRVGEPSSFQEYGPAGYHVSIGFANPKIINSRLAGVCGKTDPNIQGSNCTNTVKGVATMERMSRTPDERLYSSGDNSAFAFTQCYVSFGDADGEDFAFTKCGADGSFSLSGLPDGDWRITVFDQWNDMLVDGLSTPVRLAAGNDQKCPGSTSAASICDMGQIAMNQWQANIYTRTFFDQNGNGIADRDSTGNDLEPGLTLVPTNIRYRDGSFSNFNNTDLNGYANFNEVFPLFNWYVVETDSTRYKNTGTHVVYDAGGPADGTCGPSTAPCGSSKIAANMANSAEVVSLPTDLRVPGAVYCAGADCTGKSIATPSSDPPSVCSVNSAGQTTCSTQLSTGRIDPPWVLTEGWQGFSGQNSFIEFGKAPYATGENGGIKGHVVYASTRPFDDPQLLLQTSWEPLVPGVTINLYQEGTGADGTQTLKLVDTTKTSSWDDWAQGFRSDGKPNMNCAGQGTASGPNGDLFYFSLFNQPDWLDAYNNGGTPAHTIPYNSQYKCYDGMHTWNQIQPAPYDGMYKFPSIIGRDPSTGAPTGAGVTNGVAGTRPGSNCTVCVANPTDGTPMLPIGKYVVEVIVPPGYELVKEEDKNILIGDNYIAPPVQEFGSLGNIYIMPDQATVANGYNSQNSTQSLGRSSSLPSHEGDTGTIETYWPCVGQARIVPDFISLFPLSGEVAPFAGATRNLCDRKEVTLEDQTSALAKFYIFTETHAAAHFTGVITDDYTSEFDPFAPQFGEKFAPPDLPISIKDWTGTEISRVYADHWGAYNGLTYSTWEVNPPNPTGYAPTMMVTCMNDPGSGATPDPLFNPAYSQFCYEIPFMPGQTQYMDTPVVPTSAFAGAGYNNPDCNYPNATPAIKSVIGNDGVAGPWVKASGATHTLTITALGDQQVGNNAYSGPSATAAPFNQKTATRHYGFGSAAGTVTIGGIAATVSSWSDVAIVVQVPSGVPNCAVQQQAQYGGSTAQCGQLVITAANGQQSIDAITVTIGGKTPTVLAPTQTIQAALDAAAPGDMIVVPPGSYSEILIMWKPVRLQGVGAATSIVNANTHPAGKIDVWRRQVNCLFGLALNGTAISPTNPFDPNYNSTAKTGYSCPSANGNTWNYFVGAVNKPQVDRLPLEATIGWDASLNGNLAELLQEPSLMGALEGAAITVLSKGVDFHGQNPFDASLAAGFPTGTTLLQDTPGIPGNKASCGVTPNPFPSNFECNPSSIDGLGITNSSQGGGGIFVHGWGHNLQIANNRINNNAGTLSGGINVGQGEHSDINVGGTAATNADPGSCQTSNVTNLSLPYCFDLNVNVHNNMITSNSSTGDELFSATPAGAGGVSFCSGSDYYKFNYNWLCGNLSSGDGGGLGHLGFSYNGDIEYNWILFNQSTNPTIAANGGGMVIMGAPDADPTCGAITDTDCTDTTVTPSDGIGNLLTINANLIQGNAADSGSGGGIRLQNVNGTDVVNFPTTPSLWNHVSITNNIIVNNVAGWDGAGISLLDALNTDFVNNTVMSNDTTASSGVLFNTIGAPLASSSGPTCTSNCGISSTPQPAGLVATQNSAVLTANLPAAITCPTGHYGGASANNGTCRQASYPLMFNDLFWQNRSFYIGVGALGTGTVNQQNVVALYNGFSTQKAVSQPTTDAVTANGSGVIVTGGSGACVTPSTANFWDIGVRGDTGPTNHSSGVTLAPNHSIVGTGGYAGSGNLANNPTVISQYCNGSRTPPEFNSMGYQVPPGISDATVPNPIFSLTPAATVDEGNNWINLSWGPLALTHPISGSVLGNYGPATGSPVADAGAGSLSGVVAPPTDFYGHTRTGAPDIGAVELLGAKAVLTSITPNSGAAGLVVPVTIAGTNTAGATAVTVSGPGIAVSGVTSTATTVSATFTIAASALTSARNVTVTTPAGVSNAVTFTVTPVPVPTLTSIAPNSGAQGSAVSVTLTGANFVTGDNVVITPSATGVSVSGVSVVSPTTMTAVITSTGAAALGAVNVAAVSTTGSSATQPFTITAAPPPTSPVLTALNPIQGLRRSGAPRPIVVTLTGSNFTPTGTTINVAPANGLFITGVTYLNSTTLRATFNTTNTAAIGPRSITVTTPNGTSNALTYTVLGPVLNSISPASGAHGSVVPVTLLGTGLTGNVAINVSGAGITVSNVVVAPGGGQVTANFTIAANAAATARTVTVSTPNGGTSNSVTFTVN